MTNELAPLAGVCSAPAVLTVQVAGRKIQYKSSPSGKRELHCTCVQVLRSMLVQGSVKYDSFKLPSKVAGKWKCKGRAQRKDAERLARTVINPSGLSISTHNFEIVRSNHSYWLIL